MPWSWPASSCSRRGCCARPGSPPSPWPCGSGSVGLSTASRRAPRPSAGGSWRTSVAIVASPPTGRSMMPSVGCCTRSCWCLTSGGSIRTASTTPRSFRSWTPSTFKTNHLIDGETHVPETMESVQKVGFELLHRWFGDDCFAIFELFTHLVVGWPVYLFLNVTGGRRLKGQELEKPLPMKLGIVDHFRPSSPLFPESWQIRIALSTLGVVLTLLGIAAATRAFGWSALLVHYWMPYLWVNFWLVLYTWLQHTDPNIPHYGDDDWTWVKGALCTIDRPYGFFDWMHHHIGSTHVAHHLFSTLPCYRAEEATRHLKAYLEPRGLYNYDATPWPLAAWRVAKTCHFVEDVKGTQYYKSFGSKSKKH
mmetsp:Transcript_138920/g.443198  ORF Transcript_138920/g.443198 Transcript_138920/m.443198 type:complete len:364 (-) Transcript_138920:75-1166(-)